MLTRTGIAALLTLLGAVSPCVRGEILETAKIHLNQTTAVGSSWLPAGDYLVSLAHMASNQATLIIENVDTRASIFVPASRTESKSGVTPERAGIVLREADGHVYLTSVWFDGHLDGYLIQTTPLNKKLPAVRRARSQ